MPLTVSTRTSHAWCHNDRHEQRQRVTYVAFFFCRGTRAGARQNDICLLYLPCNMKTSHMHLHLVLYACSSSSETTAPATPTDGPDEYVPLSPFTVQHRDRLYVSTNIQAVLSFQNMVSFSEQLSLQPCVRCSRTQQQKRPPPSVYQNELPTRPPASYCLHTSNHTVPRQSSRAGSARSIETWYTHPSPASYERLAQSRTVLVRRGYLPLR